MKYHFAMTFKLASVDQDPDEIVGRLGAAGCDDSTVGIGVPGRVGLMFTREADSAQQAVFSAIADVKRALPDAELTEIGPDFAGLTDIAELVGVSRQNMRKLMVNHPGNFPAPVYEGTTSLWRLAPVLEWLIARGYSIDQRLLDVARITMQVNLVKDRQHLDQPFENRISALLAYPKHDLASKEPATALRK